MPITANGFDDDDDDDDEVGECPECHAEVYLIANLCPKCGHWFQEDERSSMSRGGKAPWDKVVKAASIALLAAIGVGIVAAVVAK
jgi:predicted amidophosphoribosyltransferase